jgi:hypothetical protein
MKERGRHIFEGKAMNIAALVQHIRLATMGVS